MLKAELLYEGKAKKVYRARGQQDLLVLAYKDDATAFNGKKKETFGGKARLNNDISARIFSHLNAQGIASHFIEKLNETEQLVKETKIIPLEVVLRNKATGSITKRLGIAEKTVFAPPLIELFFKNDALDDPLINDDHALLLTDLSASELAEVKEQTLRINVALQGLFESIHLDLIDFKLEFGRLPDGSIVLSDEISPDTCRLWDLQTKENMDKDVFRKGTGDLISVYEKVLKRLKTLE